MTPTLIRGALLAAMLTTTPLEPTARTTNDLLGDALQGVAFGDSVADVTRKLDGQCDALERHDIDAPYFPLAADAQTHLIALGVHAVGVDEIAFTFGDDALVQVELRGGVVEGLLPAIEQEPVSMFDFQAWPEARVVAHLEQDAVWLLNPEGLHPHLYTWSNPDLPSVAARAEPYEQAAARPPMLDFGGELEKLLPRMEKASAFTARETIAEPWLPAKPATQTQINCFGVEYAGFPRKVEAVFGDGVLELAWILTGKAEEPRVRRALVSAFGEPIFVSKMWEVFDDWRVALRKDKPEVLMLSDGLVATYRGQFEATAD